MRSNDKDKDDVCYAQPKSLEQRVAIANDFTKRFKFALPFGIDDMNNAANDAFAAWPERLYIVDEAGKISYKGGNGPFKYDPKEVRNWLAGRYGEVKPAATPASPASPETPPVATTPSEKKS